MSTWKPIDEAPIDGTEILLRDKDKYVSVGYWFCKKNGLDSRGKWVMNINDYHGFPIRFGGNGYDDAVEFMLIPD